MGIEEEKGDQGEGCCEGPMGDKTRVGAMEGAEVCVS